MSKKDLKLGIIRLMKYPKEQIFSMKAYIFHDEVGYKIERGQVRHNVENSVDQLVVEIIENKEPKFYPIDIDQWQKIIDNDLFNQVVNFKINADYTCVGYCDRKSRGFYCDISCHIDRAKIKFPKKDVVLGVGDGSGKLFVKGSYEAVKAVQNMILERDMLREQIANLETIIKNKGQDNPD